MSEFRSEIRKQVASGRKPISRAFIMELTNMMKDCVEAGGNCIKIKMPKINEDESPYCEIFFTYDK